MAVRDVYALYINKVERKGQRVEDLNTVTCWLTGLTQPELDSHLQSGTTFTEFFNSVTIHPNACLITGTICGIRIEEIADPLMQKIRYLDKLVDEVARGRPMEKILRSSHI